MPKFDDLKVFSTDANAISWMERHNPKNGMSNYIKILHQDSETGMRVNLCFYPKGLATKWHTHPCAHGMYVLEGILKTHEGVYGPGSFIWFPEGIVAEHGATAETDVLTLFVTNKLFGIDYVDQEQKRS